MRIGFDNEKYITMQADRIHQRISEFGGKLYLEFGGKLLDATTLLASSLDLLQMQKLKCFSSLLTRQRLSLPSTQTTLKTASVEATLALPMPMTC